MLLCLNNWTDFGELKVREKLIFWKFLKEACVIFQDWSETNVRLQEYQKYLNNTKQMIIPTRKYYVQHKV